MGRFVVNTGESGWWLSLIYGVVVLFEVRLPETRRSSALVRDLARAERLVRDILRFA